MKKILPLCLLAAAFGAQAGQFEARDCIREGMDVRLDTEETKQKLPIAYVEFCPRWIPWQETYGFICKDNSSSMRCVPMAYANDEFGKQPTRYCGNFHRYFYKQLRCGDAKTPSF